MKHRHYAYLAGTIDGDGCIAASRTFQKRSNCFQYDLKIEATSSFRSTARRLIELFGGTHHKNIIDGVVYWKWVCQVREKQRSVLEGMLPYLVIKKKQAEHALEFVSLGRAENPAKRQELVFSIQSLNRKLREDTNDLPLTGSKEVSAYVAGLVDSEGTLSIVRKGQSTSPYIAVYNDSTRLMAWIERSVGGESKLHKPPNHLIWRFSGNNHDREIFLLSILPYLITKKQQGITLLEYVRMFKRKDRAARQILFDKMWALNHTRTSETNTPDCPLGQMTEPELMGNYESVAPVTAIT